MDEQRGFALILNGSGLKGFASLGIVEVLEKEGFPIGCILGSGVGSFVGGLHLCGTLKDFKEKFVSSEQIQTLISGKNQRNFDQLSAFFLKKNIEEFPQKFASISRDLKTGKLVILERGDLFKIVRGSMSIPGIFDEVFLENMNLGESHLEIPSFFGSFFAKKVIHVSFSSGEISLKDLFFKKEIFEKLPTFNPRCCVTLLPEIKKINVSDPQQLIQSGRNCAERNLDSLLRLLKRR